jgi:hypothetical protein
MKGKLFVNRHLRQILIQCATFLGVLLALAAIVAFVVLVYHLTESSGRRP